MASGAPLIFDNVDGVDTTPAAAGSTGKLVRQVMWVGIACFAVIRFILARQSLEGGGSILFEGPSAPQIAQVWAEYVAQVMLAVTVGLAVSLFPGK
jgi:hypothetical protein